jgi:tRNA nucleotidyltransferase (CCA-adding enzyme)
MVMLRHMQSIHPLATEICHILQNAGHQAYIVGGCVRDLILGETPKDFDITTSAIPEEVVQLFPRTIPTGLKHGTITVCMDEGIENHFEVTTFRTDGQYLDGRRPENVKFVQNVEEDLARRDFTINAMAYDPIKLILIDPFNGKDDLKLEIIRAVGDPTARFQEDGLRIIRAARFAARFGYIIDSSTLLGVKNSLDTLKKVSKERISDELRKILMAAYPSLGLQWLSICGALSIICPNLMEQAANSFFPLTGNYSGKLETRLALMYSFVPVKTAQQELMDLKFSNKEIERVIFLLETLKCYDGKDYRRFMARFKNEAPDAWEQALSQFKTLTEAHGASIQDWLDQHRDVKVWARKELAINGNDLIEMGIKPGPEIKSILNGCYDEILEHPEHNNRYFLMRLANTLSTLL